MSSGFTAVNHDSNIPDQVQKNNNSNVVSAMNNANGAASSNPPKTNGSSHLSQLRKKDDNDLSSDSSVSDDDKSSATSNPKLGAKASSPQHEEAASDVGSDPEESHSASECDASGDADGDSPAHPSTGGKSLQKLKEVLDKQEADDPDHIKKIPVMNSVELKAKLIAAGVDVHGLTVQPLRVRYLLHIKGLDIHELHDRCFRLLHKTETEDLKERLKVLKQYPKGVSKAVLVARILTAEEELYGENYDGDDGVPLKASANESSKSPSPKSKKGLPSAATVSGNEPSPPVKGKSKKRDRDEEAASAGNNGTMEKKRMLHDGVRENATKLSKSPVVPDSEDELLDSPVTPAAPRKTLVPASRKPKPTANINAKLNPRKREVDEDDEASRDKEASGAKSNKRPKTPTTHVNTHNDMSEKQKGKVVKSKKGPTIAQARVAKSSMSPPQTPKPKWSLRDPQLNEFCEDSLVINDKIDTRLLFEDQSVPKQLLLSAIRIALACAEQDDAVSIHEFRQDLPVYKAYIAAHPDRPFQPRDDAEEAWLKQQRQHWEPLELEAVAFSAGDELRKERPKLEKGVALGDYYTALKEFGSDARCTKEKKEEVRMIELLALKQEGVRLASAEFRDIRRKGLK